MSFKLIFKSAVQTKDHPLFFQLNLVLIKLIKKKTILFFSFFYILKFELVRSFIHSFMVCKYHAFYFPQSDLIKYCCVQGTTQTWM
jgi:hypothetical protein